MRCSFTPGRNKSAIWLFEPFIHSHLDNVVLEQLAQRVYSDTVLSHGWVFIAAALLGPMRSSWSKQWSILNGVPKTVVARWEGRVGAVPQQSEWNRTPNRWFRWKLVSWWGDYQRKRRLKPPTVDLSPPLIGGALTDIEKLWLIWPAPSRRLSPRNCLEIGYLGIQLICLLLL